MTRRWLLALCVAIACAVGSAFDACIAADLGDANLAWDSALVALPGGVRTSLKYLKDTGRYSTFVKPDAVVVLYLHGHDGIQDKGVVPHDGYQISNRMNAVVIAPDSFARKGRIANESVGGRATFPQSIVYRMQEITYALQQIVKMPGVNLNKLVLFGHSEGGKAAANWAGHEFRAIIVTGWNCSTQETAYAGTKIPTDIPVMNIVGVRDEDLKSNPAKSCANVLTHHTTKEVINPNVKEHWFNNKYYPEIVQFIQDNTR